MVYENNIQVLKMGLNQFPIWFQLFETQFASARITKDEVEYSIVINNLDKRYYKRAEDIIMCPPLKRKYIFLRKELVKRLGDSDNIRVRKLF